MQKYITHYNMNLENSFCITDRYVAGVNSLWPDRSYRVPSRPHFKIPSFSILHRNPDVRRPFPPTQFLTFLFIPTSQRVGSKWEPSNKNKSFTPIEKHFFYYVNYSNVLLEVIRDFCLCSSFKYIILMLKGKNMKISHGNIN